ncbi:MULTISPECIES: B12-binding domain-containing radical SAM protein [Anaerostipes]|uniref:B12-binding domain-containing radical SAM protein n=1 Tax=Anaerostipes TaxID=207244 RepID=UPI0009527D18|nr:MULTISPECIES: B12-binding domain-containing radical SAM protein [unclassified Anaerostipes]MCI5624212.1 B12-binding domain-containing radical SAM protein [Anaerostipes sp.]OLR58399.1 B12-binding domain-containing radical SAM protein [Anaerostipes sp. 494a]
MNIILTAINAKYIHSNLAVYCLRAYAKPYKEDIQIAEYTINQQIDDMIMDLYKRKPDILCFSCYIWNIEYVERVLREIKKLFPSLPIWLGGPEVSYDSHNVLERLPEVTGVIKGEGEQTFLEVMGYYHGKIHDLSEIDGITYRNQDKIIENPWRSVIDLSSVPFVYDHMEDFEHKIIYYESSRGCPFSCSYCLSSIDKCLRFRNLSLVKKELQFFIDHKVPQVKFVDRTFNCNHQHALEIWRFIKEHDNGITNFHFEVAADLLNEEELTLISDMRPGLIQLEIGVQSTNPKTINEIHRKMDFQKVAKIVDRINAGHNIHQHLDLIAGLPYEDLESFQKSFNDVYAVKPEQLQLGFLKVLKGSYMEQQKDAYGLVFKDIPPYEVLYTNWLPYDQMLILKSIENIVEIYYNSGQFSYTMRYLEHEFSSAFEMYRKLGEFYESEGYHKMNHSRISRYEILFQFIKRHSSKEKLPFYQELLTFDLYLRENIKNRPDFAGEYSIGKEELYYLYDEVLSKDPVLNVYAKKNMRKMMHIEKFHYAVHTDGKPAETILLFDYLERNPLNHQAKIISVK